MSDGSKDRHESGAREDIELLRAALENSPHGVMLEAAGTVVYANAPYARLQGEGDSQALLGRPVSDLRPMPPDSGNGGSDSEPVLELQRQQFQFGSQPAAISIVRDATPHRRAHLELQHALDWRQAIFEGSRDAIFISDAAHALVDVNPAACALTGFSREQLLQIHLTDLHDDADLASFRHRFARIMAGEEILSEAKLRRADGSKIEVEFSNRCIEIQGRVYVHTVGRDIRERRHAEAALRQSEERYRLLFQQNLAGVFRSTIEGEFLDCNDSFARMFGYADREDALAQPPWKFHGCPEKRAAFMQGLRQERFLVNYEFSGSRRDGSEVWGLENVGLLPDATGELRIVQGTMIDITDRKQAEQALRQNEERLRALLENSSDAILLLREGGIIVYASRAVERILGYSPEEALGRSSYEFIHPADRERVRLAREHSEPGGAVTLEARILHKDGSWRYVESVGVNRLNDPVIGAYIVNFRDITDRKELEQQLRDAHKMEAVARLVGGVAHDFNNLLTAIMLYSDLLLETLSTRSNQRRYADEVRMAAARGSALVRQLLAFARQQAMDPKVVSLNAVIEGMRELLERLLGEHVHLVTELAGGLGSVRVDPLQMQQVIMNLAFNARDAMPDGGTLTIQTGHLTLAGSSARQVAPTGNYVVLTVSDTGCGMDAHVREHVFEPFFTTKEQGKGTGLGLPTVYGIVSQSGGTISIDSEAGKGTRITVLLPRVDAPAQEPTLRRLPAQMAHGSETILLVEDEAIVRESVSQLLRECGYRVIETRNGGEAVALAREHHGVIDLLITDLVMPGMSGREVARHVAALQPGAKLLFMSGYDQGNQALDTSVFSKPFTRAALAQKVREVLDAPSPHSSADPDAHVVPTS